jgi:hypothetical protein
MGCGVLQFTGVIFTVHSVTNDVVVILTGEETVAILADDVPGCPLFSVGCSNMITVELDSRYSSDLDQGQRWVLYTGNALVDAC